MNIQQKQQLIETMTQHRNADRLIQGQWISSSKDSNNLYRGCFFGCAMQTNDNPLEKATIEMDLPEWLIRLVEAIFEGLPSVQAIEFPVQFLKAIPVDTDLESVKHMIAVKRMDRLIEQFKDCTEYGLLDALKLTREYHLDPAEEKRVVARLAARSARSAAWSAAWSAAYSAAWSAAESAADSAAESAAESAADSAAWSAAESAESAAAWSTAESAAAWSTAESASAARSAAYSASWEIERDELLNALKQVGEK